MYTHACVYIGLQKLKEKLDNRIKAKELGSGRFKPRERIESTVSDLPPPENPIKWAVQMLSNGYVKSILLYVPGVAS